MMRLFALLALCLALPAAAQESRLRSLQTSDDGRGWSAVGRIDLGTGGFCTGTLIADDLVLTAAHCLFNRETKALIDPATIRFLAGWRNGRAEAYRGVTRALAHPDYAYGEADPLLRVGFDIALLRLDQPIRLPSIIPFGIGIEPGVGSEVGIVSYAKDRSEAPSLQEVCHVMGGRSDLLVLTCSVDFGASGAPVLALRDGVMRIVSVVSAKAEVDGNPVALAVPLEIPLTRLRDEMLAGARAPLTGVRVLSGGGQGGAKFIRAEPATP
jgi:protease YdgD